MISHLGYSYLNRNRYSAPPSRRTISATVSVTAYAGVEKSVSEIVLCLWSSKASM